MVLLDEAIGDWPGPVAGAGAAVAVVGDLLLGHACRAYLSLYGASAEGVAAAADILKRLQWSRRA